MARSTTRRLVFRKKQAVKKTSGAPTPKSASARPAKSKKPRAPVNINRSTRGFKRSPAVEFRLFPKLPPEMREKIWLATLPDQRLVPIRFEMSQSGFYFNLFPAHTTIPLALHTTRESRKIALRHYTLFPARKKPGKMLPGVGQTMTPDPTAMIYLDPKTDVLFFPQQGLAFELHRLQLGARHPYQLNGRPRPPLTLRFPNGLPLQIEQFGISCRTGNRLELMYIMDLAKSFFPNLQKLVVSMSPMESQSETQFRYRVAQSKHMEFSEKTVLWYDSALIDRWDREVADATIRLALTDPTWTPPTVEIMGPSHRRPTELVKVGARRCVVTFRLNARQQSLLTFTTSSSSQSVPATYPGPKIIRLPRG